MPKKSQEALSKKRAKIVEKIAAIKAIYEEKLAVEYAKLEALRGTCTHPNLRHYNVGFDSGSQCPDCGYSD
jgi:hypothetical protein